MFSRLLVLVLILKDVFAIAEEIRPSPEPIYDFPINQDIFRMTNGTPGIGSVARQPPPGRLGIRQVRSSRCQILKGAYKLCFAAWTGDHVPCWHHSSLYRFNLPMLRRPLSSLLSIGLPLLLEYQSLRPNY